MHHSSLCLYHSNLCLLLHMAFSLCLTVSTWSFSLCVSVLFLSGHQSYWIKGLAYSSMPSSLLFSHWVISDSLQPRGLQSSTLFCPSLYLGSCSSSCPLSWWCHLTISSPATRFSLCLQSFPASESFPVSWLFASGGQSIGDSASASVLPMNIQDWFPLELTGLISL